MSPLRTRCQASTDPWSFSRERGTGWVPAYRVRDDSEVCRFDSEGRDGPEGRDEGGGHVDSAPGLPSRKGRAQRHDLGVGAPSVDAVLSAWDRLLTATTFMGSPLGTAASPPSFLVLFGVVHEPALPPRLLSSIDTSMKWMSESGYDLISGLMLISSSYSSHSGSGLTPRS
ncbi:hypothetical protein CspHIS471_0609330 [Cutaneotrichosporon sp. HIS471]|nr:hypothetical protein CspHIS471_0609330 [Cutaneotrichosporon sp. HIS471]